MERMEKQTAVEWLVSELMSKGIINADGWVWDDDVSIVDITKQAKEMEKQQIIDAVIWFDDTERTPSQIDIIVQQYYNETFKSE